MPGGAMLEIVDDNDAVIGVRSREEIHALGFVTARCISGSSRPKTASSFSAEARSRTRFPT